MKTFKSLFSFRQFSVSVALLAALWSSLASADDRSLLSVASQEPYVFIILDTSGSMNYILGEAELPFLRAGSPDSKMYQAKEALYKVVSELEDIQFGFTSFNQNRIGIFEKHWLYVADEAGVTLDDGTIFPALGEEHVFGRSQSCGGFPEEDHVGCDTSTFLAADLADPWEKRRIQMYSKLGATGLDASAIFIRASSINYQVTFTPASGSIGDTTIDVALNFIGYDDDFNLTGFEEDKTVTFRKAPNAEGGFVGYDEGTRRSTPSNPNGRQAFFQDFDMTLNGACNGWEGNGDTSSDQYQGSGTTYRNLRVVTDTSEPEVYLQYGDVIPLNWQNANREELLDRLSPNRLLEDPDAAGFEPDFGLGSYLTDVPTDGKLDLITGLRDAGGTIFVPASTTPLGYSLRDFKTWYLGSGSGGWRAVASNASTGDESFGCRNVYVLVLTDGLETCGGRGDLEAAALRAAGVKTYVVGYGVEASAGDDDLDEIAQSGGTVAPFRPQSVDELVDDLKFVFSEIQSVQASFSAAAAPSAQVNSADKVYFTDFTPIEGQSIWDGHVESFLKPVPLTADGFIDRTRICGTGDTYACMLWDAGKTMLDQSLLPSEVDAAFGTGVTVDPVGTQVDERRVYYAPGIPSTSLPASRAYFWADDDSTAAEWSDLLFSLGIPMVDPSTPSTSEKSAGKAVLKDIYAKRALTITFQKPDGTTEQRNIVTVLGDSFHSDPLVVNNPNHFGLFSVDYGTTDKACDDASEPNPGYRCFVQKQLYRRRMLLIGSNDGQIHGFDAGVLRERTSTSGVLREFDNGTGREIFSFLPRGVMDTVRRLSTGSRHRYTVDGGLRVEDVFIDPAHSGTPTATQREWRSVAIGGLREGGRSIFAVDITQPDVLGTGIDSNNVLENIPVPLTGSDGLVSNYVPSCGAGGTGCGTLPFATPLWEFTDTTDDDGNGLPDLGDTWSKPVVGLIQLTVGSNVEDRFVAIFGGGLDPDFRQSDVSGTPATDIEVVGNWLYMVDMETGLPLYKRRVNGAVPSAISAVDTNRDLYLDTLYFGTIAGLMYKVDMSAFPAPDAGALLTPTTTAEEEVWQPFPIFDTDSRPIFYPPSVIFVAEKNLFALGFGTGYREDLWLAPAGQAGRYYLLLDTGFAAPFTTLVATDLDPVTTDPTNQTTDQYLLNGGWFIDLRAGERLTSNSFAVAGITLFNTYKPDVPNPSTSGAGLNVCARTGESRIYLLNTLNGNGYIRDPGNPTSPNREKFISLFGFAASPFSEQLGTKNVDSTAGGGGGGAPTKTADEMTDALKDLLEEMKSQFPDICRYSNRNRAVRLQLQRNQGVGSLETPLVFGVCTVPHNWKEF